MSEAPKRRADLARWRELASVELRGADPDRLVWETPEGLTVKALYTAADIEDLEFANTLPGLAPFVRGTTRDDVRESALDDSPVRGLFDGRRVERLLSAQSRGRPERPCPWPSISRPIAVTTPITLA